MHAAGHAYNLLSDQELGRIHRAALRILDEMGMEIQNRHLLSVLAEHGLRVDLDAWRVRFPTALVEEFLATAEKFDWEGAQPTVSATAGVYHGRYHDPSTGGLLPWDEERLAFYFSLARQLPGIDGANMLGCRIPVQAELEPLYERYYCWKYGAREGSSIYIDEICPYLLELYQARAAELGRPLAEVFQGTVYLVPALKLGAHEAYQVDYFRERGLRVRIGGGMHAMGANAPVTLAGAVALGLAERLALLVLDWALFGVKKLVLGCSISPMDMKTMIYPFGRPERGIANLMTAQLARFYGAEFHGHGGLTDAKLPSAEAGYQKALTGIPILLAGGSLWMDAGLLAVDEVYSPIQMVLDSEFLSALRRFTLEFAVDEESIALETILQAGPGGQYLDQPHTARHHRAELWMPGIWSREMLGPWLEAGGRIDAERAREQVLEMQRQLPESPRISQGFERELLALIERARRGLSLPLIASK